MAEKKSTTKKIRTDSATGQVRAMQAASAGVLKPPTHVSLRADDWPFWEGIIKSRARDTWTDVDLVKAASLARCQADIVRLSLEVEKEGDVEVNQHGISSISAKNKLLEVLIRREVALSRALHVHAEATVGKSEDATKKLKAEQAARKVIGEFEDDLIPGLGTAYQ